MIDRITWLGHASFRIDGPKTVYIDPWKIRGGASADLILITHSHYDHLSAEDVAKIQGPRTVIVATADSAKQLQGDVRVVKPGDRLTLDGVSIEVVSAYNTNKQFHPRTNNWVGYVVELGGSRIYHPGDTDLIPEMERVRCDIALLPVSGTYVMTAQEAAQAANKIKPRFAIPMHYGDIVGSRVDAEKFKELAACEVRILEPTDRPP
ncbi:MAG: MBL fold metallo-hydrolase [Chloroflexi bacterium]|nr:MBL fold metallo-hydrolase [Chloroflexota bacterium]